MHEREDIYSAEPNYRMLSDLAPNDSEYTSGDQWANHSWLQSLVNIRCTKCRLVTDAVPVQPTKKQDVEFENINFVLVDNFEKNKDFFQ